MDGSAANDAAIKRYNEAHGPAIEIRQRKYRNNMVEQDHRAVQPTFRTAFSYVGYFCVRLEVR
jgi:transposase-like protein